MNLNRCFFSSTGAGNRVRRCLALTVLLAALLGSLASTGWFWQPPAQPPGIAETCAPEDWLPELVPTTREQAIDIVCTYLTACEEQRGKVVESKQSCLAYQAALLDCPELGYQFDDRHAQLCQAYNASGRCNLEPYSGDNPCLAVIGPPSHVHRADACQPCTGLCVAGYMCSAPCGFCLPTAKVMTSPFQTDQPNGSECSGPQNCTSGWCESRRPDPGVCADPPGRGDPCIDLNCGGELICVGGVCVDAGGTGAACTDSSQCLLMSHYCSAGHCVARTSECRFAAAGEACLVTALSCGSGLGCDVSSMNCRLLAAGECAGRPEDCPSDQYCDANYRCHSYLAPGAICVETERCTPGTACRDTHAGYSCTPVAAEGEVCASDEQCYNSICVAHVCSVCG